MVHQADVCVWTYGRVSHWGVWGTYTKHTNPPVNDGCEADGVLGGHGSRHKRGVERINVGGCWAGEGHARALKIECVNAPVD